VINVSARNESSGLPFWLILAAACLAIGVAVIAGSANLIFQVKAIVGIIGLTAACGMVFHRPVTLPLAAFFFMVPFDNLLQTGGGTATKFLAIAATGSIFLVLLDHRRRVSAPTSVVVWGVFLCWSIAALIWSINVPGSIAYLTTVLLLFATYVVISMLRIRRNELVFLCGAVVAGGVVCASYGIWLFTHGTFVSRNGLASERLTIALGHGSFINADHFAGALVFPFALALIATLNLRGWRKAFMAIATMLLLGGIFVSATRGSVIAVGVIFLYLLIRYGHRVQLAVIAAIGLAASIPVPSVWLRFTDPSQGQAGGRLGIWGLAWEAFRHHWLYGVGPGLFYLAYGENFLKAGISGMQPWAQDAHNLIVSTGVEVGIVGLALMLAGWVFQFLTVRVIPRSSSFFNLRVAIEAGLIGLFVVSMSADIFFYKYLWIAFILAILVRNAWLGEELAAQNTAPSAIPTPQGDQSAAYGQFEVTETEGDTFPGQAAEKRLASAART
jgi:O-antigen ligase